MTIYNIALIGFGGVNRALAELIAAKNQLWERDLGFRLNIVAVSDLYLGSVISPNGLDAKTLIEAKFEKGGFGQLSGGNAETDNETIIKMAPADIIVEATFTNPKDGEPAVSHCRWALETGKHVVTTNKGPVAIAAQALKALATANGVRFEYEGAVMSGTPVIRLAHKMLGGLELTAVQGILNGTSNYVLGRMEAGLRLDEAIAEAQDLGYAEADPTADIGGSDVRLKVAILANELLGASMNPSDVETTGIQDIKSDDVAKALARGLRWKLIGDARREADGRVVATVKPIALQADHPLAGISGATNAVSFTTDLLGAVTVSGPGAGRVETAYALISDIMAVNEFVKGAVRA